MVDDESMNNNERASQLAVAVGMLLFASVIFGSGVLGDAGEDRLSDGNDRGDQMSILTQQVIVKKKTTDLETIGWKEISAKIWPVWK